MAANLLQGTLDLLILKSLAQAGFLHGMDFIAHICRHSGTRIRVAQGSLYPALNRLEKHGLIVSRPERTLFGRPARVYTITPAGERQLRLLRRRWTNIAEGVDALLSRP